MAHWVQKVKRYDPVRVEPQSIYRLHNRYPGRTIVVVAPGPSLDDFPREELYNWITIGVNSAAELISPSYWLFQEGMFCKKYYKIYTTKWIKRIVTTFERGALLKRILPEGELFTYTCKSHSVLRMKKNHPVPTGAPYWFQEEAGFLPGHNSVSANAMSLAVLMGASRIILIGVDLNFEETYYASGVKRNPGPRLRERALSASRAWMKKAAKRGVWKGPEIFTTSPWLRLFGVKRISVSEALKMLKEQDESQRHHTRA